MALQPGKVNFLGSKSYYDRNILAFLNTEMLRNAENKLVSRFVDYIIFFCRKYHSY